MLLYVFFDRAVLLSDNIYGALVPVKSKCTDCTSRWTKCEQIRAVEWPLNVGLGIVLNVYLGANTVRFISVTKTTLSSQRFSLFPFKQRKNKS